MGADAGLRHVGDGVPGQGLPVELVDLAGVQRLALLLPLDAAEAEQTASLDVDEGGEADVEGQEFVVLRHYLLLGWVL